jgi:hypothetical protein
MIRQNLAVSVVVKLLKNESSTKMLMVFRQKIKWLQRAESPWFPPLIINYKYISMICSVADPDHFDMDPDAAFHLDMDPII